jgi:hypothetical protein
MSEAVKELDDQSWALKTLQFSTSGVAMRTWVIKVNIAVFVE